MGTSLWFSSSMGASLYIKYRRLPDLVSDYLSRYKDRAAFESHGTSNHFQSAGKTMSDEGLLAKPLEIKVLGALAGFASK